MEQAGCHRACCCWPQGAYTCRVGWPDQPGHHVSTRGTQLDFHGSVLQRRIFLQQEFSTNYSAATTSRLSLLGY